MEKKQIIENTIVFVKNKLAGDSSGHDWWHIYRVWNMATKIQHKEGGDLFIVELAALLHDIADWKFQNEERGIQQVVDFLKEQKIEDEIIDRIVEIIQQVSYKGAGVKDKMEGIEGKIVQDADRLDAIGAIGIARTFAFGGKFGNEMHHPETKAQMHNNFEEYKNSRGTTINHFYEKLLLLKDRLNTNEAKEIALGRHQFMETFLNQFYDEWDGIK